jgi:mRNA-degrading endonuclease RelE of RelBE toxin-antitoxin system
LPYALLAHPTAQKELDALPKTIADGIRAVLRALADEPRSRRFDLKALKAVDDEPPAMRLRIGHYRVLLRIHHDLREIRIARVGHRRSVYRGLGHVMD